MAAEPDTDRHGGAPTQEEHREQLASIVRRARTNARKVNDTRLKGTIDRKYAALKGES